MFEPVVNGNLLNDLRIVLLDQVGQLATQPVLPRKNHPPVLSWLKATTAMRLLTVAADRAYELIFTQNAGDGAMLQGDTVDEARQSVFPLYQADLSSFMHRHVETVQDTLTKNVMENPNLVAVSGFPDKVYTAAGQGVELARTRLKQVFSCLSRGLPTDFRGDDFGRFDTAVRDLKREMENDFFPKLPGYSASSKVGRLTGCISECMTGAASEDFDVAIGGNWAGLGVPNTSPVRLSGLVLSEMGLLSGAGSLPALPTPLSPAAYGVREMALVFATLSQHLAEDGGSLRYSALAKYGKSVTKEAWQAGLYPVQTVLQRAVQQAAMNIRVKNGDVVPAAKAAKLVQYPMQTPTVH